MSRIGCIGLAATFGGILLLGVIAVIFGPDRIPEQPKPHRDDAAALVITEREIRARLKAPSTAKFSSILETECRYHGDGVHSFIGWVDAQNSFGAQIRTRYVCVVRNGGGDQWAVLKCETE